MHGYCVGQIQEQNRKKINKTLFGLSIVLTPLLNSLIVLVIGKISSYESLKKIIDWLIENGVTMSISYIVTYAILFFLVDNYLWSMLLSKILNIPNLGGIWEGTLISNFDDNTHNMTLKVKQTMTNISCLATFDASSSSSETAKIEYVSGNQIKLTYTYKNISRQQELMQGEHYGYSQLFVSEGNDKLEMNGRYFTNRLRDEDNNTTGGTIKLTKVSKKKAKKQAS